MKRPPRISKHLLSADWSFFLFKFPTETGSRSAACPMFFCLYRLHPQRIGPVGLSTNRPTIGSPPLLRIDYDLSGRPGRLPIPTPPSFPFQKHPISVSQCLSIHLRHWRAPPRQAFNLAPLRRPIRLTLSFLRLLSDYGQIQAWS